MFLIGFFFRAFIKPANTFELPAPVSSKAVHLTPYANITTTG